MASSSRLMWLWTCLIMLGSAYPCSSSYVPLDLSYHIGLCISGFMSLHYIFLLHGQLHQWIMCLGCSKALLFPQREGPALSFLISLSLTLCPSPSHYSSSFFFFSLPPLLPVDLLLHFEPFVDVAVVETSQLFVVKCHCMGLPLLL